MYLNSNEKLKPSPQIFSKNYNGKNMSAHSNSNTPIIKTLEPTLTLKIIEAELNQTNSKPTELSVYTKVIYGSHEWNTNVENVKNFNPKWQESKTFVLTHDFRKRSNSSQMTNNYDIILKNSKAFYLTPEYIDIILYQKGLFKLFSDIELGRIRLNLLDLMKKPNGIEWFNLRGKKDIQGSILISYAFEKIQDIDLNPNNFKVTYCKMVGGLENNIQKKQNKTMMVQNKIGISSHYRVQTENQGNSQFKFHFNRSDQKSGCKTETSVLENEMIDEKNNSFESQEEIQKKYDQLDKKEEKSLNDEWFDKFDDLDENISNVTDSNSNEDSDSQNWNKFLYSSNKEINLLNLIEAIREENDILKKKEQSIKESFETLKNNYSRIIKEKKNIENKKMQLHMRENCLKNEKKFLKNEVDTFKKERMELQKSIDLYKDLTMNLDELKLKENSIIKKNLEMEEKILCISRSNMYLPKALFIAKKEFLKNIMNNKIMVHNSQQNNSFLNDSFQKSNKKITNETKKEEFEDDYKKKLCMRLDLEEKVNYWLLCHNLKKKNKNLVSQIENKKNDIDYMEKRMKL